MVEVGKTDQEKEERQWCCEWCDENVEHLQKKKIGSCTGEKLREKKCGKNKISVIGFFQKRIFQRVADF